MLSFLHSSRVNHNEIPAQIVTPLSYLVSGVVTIVDFHSSKDTVILEINLTRKDGQRP